MRGLVVAILVACSVSAARAESDGTIHYYIVVIGNDAEFVPALESVMEGNNTGVKAIGDRPTPALAELGPESRRLADANAAVATVWLSPTASGATLVTYERSADRFVVREVPYKLPLDATQAAETARMVRVMLRAVRDRNDTEAVTRRVRRAPQPVPEPQLAASIGVGVWFAAPKSTATAMTTLSIAWRPYGVGAAITAVLAPSIDLETLSFRGEARAVRVATEARKALRVAPSVAVTPGLGFALHRIALDGQFAASGDRVRSRRYDPALGVSALVGISLPHRVEAAVSVSVDCLLVRQRYAAGTEQILDVPRVQAMIAIQIGIRL